RPCRQASSSPARHRPGGWSARSGRWLFHFAAGRCSLEIPTMAFTPDPRFPIVTADPQKPNGSQSDSAGASTSHPGKTFGNEVYPSSGFGLSIPVPADCQLPVEVRDSLSTRPAPLKEPKGRLRRIFRAGAGILGMLILFLVFAKWALIPIILPMTND